MWPSILVLLTIIAVGYILNSSVRVIGGGDKGLVERLGRYHRTLEPGLNWIWPLIDKVVCVDTTRERVLDIEPQPTITKDNVALKVDSVVYWRVFDLKKAYYAVERIEVAIANLVLTTLRSEIGQKQMKETLSETDKLNRSLLEKLDTITANWGVKIIRVEIQSITPPQVVQKSMDLERAAESEKQAMISKAEGMAKSMQVLAHALNLPAGDPKLLNFLIAQEYVEANQKLGESANSKLVFLDPTLLNRSLSKLSDLSFTEPEGREDGDRRKDS